MSKNNILYICLAIILFGTLARVVPHIDNFAPIGAIALFAGASFASLGKGNNFLSKSKLSWWLPIVAFVISDFMLYLFRDNFPFLHDGGFALQRLFDYSCILGIAIFGEKFSQSLTENKPYLRILGAGLISSFLFYIVSNFGAWFVDGFKLPHYYTRDFSGLLSSWVAGIPFYRGTLIGDLFFSAVFFGIYLTSSQSIRSSKLEAKTSI